VRERGWPFWLPPYRASGYQPLVSELDGSIPGRKTGPTPTIRVGVPPLIFEN
jgi:hypothetical protein